jgi:hypothetical protein
MTMISNDCGDIRDDGSLFLYLRWKNFRNSNYAPQGVVGPFRSKRPYYEVKRTEETDTSGSSVW